MSLWVKPDLEAVEAQMRRAAMIQRNVDAALAQRTATDAARARAGVTPPVIRRLNQWADTSPWLPPGVLYGLAQGDIDPNSQAGRLISGAHLTNFGIGSTYPTPTTGARPTEPAAAPRPDPVADAVAAGSDPRRMPIGRPYDESVMGMAPRIADAEVWRQWTEVGDDDLAKLRATLAERTSWQPHDIDNLISYAKLNGLSPATIGKQVHRDMTDGDSFGSPAQFIDDATKERPSLWRQATAPVRGLVSDVAAEANRRAYSGSAAGGGGGAGATGGPVQAPQADVMGVTGEALSGVGGATRPAFAIADAGMQWTQAAFRTMMDTKNATSANSVEGIGGAPMVFTTGGATADVQLDVAGQTDLGIIAEELLSGNGMPDLGSGIFPNTYDPTSQVGGIRMEREARHGQIGGHNITIGRWLANRAFEPDTLPFDIASGSVDAFVAITNPGDAAMGSAIDAARGARAVTNWRYVDAIAENPAFRHADDIVRRAASDSPFDGMGVYHALEQYLEMPEVTRRAMADGRDFEAPGIFGQMNVYERRSLATYADEIEREFGEKVVTRSPWIGAIDEDVDDPLLVAGAGIADDTGGGTFSQAALTRAGADRWNARVGLSGGDVPDLPAHQLTLDEFSRSRWGDAVTADEVTEAHRSIVARAVDRGDDVPATVLFDHPELVPAEHLRDIARVDAGVLADAFRPDIVTDRFGTWLHSKSGRRMTQHLAETNTTYDVWRAYDRNIPPEIAAQIADLTDPELIGKLLARHAGVELRDPTAAAGGVGMVDNLVDHLGNTTANTWRGRARHSTARIMGHMPVAVIDTEDLGQAAKAAERWMRNAALPSDDIARVVDRIARVSDPAEMFPIVVDEMAGALRQTLLDMGVDRDLANRLSRMYGDKVAGDRMWAVNDAGVQFDLPKKMNLADGSSIDVPGPMLASEMVGRYIPLPHDARDIRNALSPLRPLVESGVWRYVLHGIPEFLTQKIWKLLTLIRPAWATRVVGEEQVRLAASGLASAFRHPIDYLMILAQRKMDEGLLDEPLVLVDKHADAMSKMGGIFNDAGRMIDNDMTKVGHYVALNPYDEGYVPAWANELAELSHDPVARQVANYGTSDETIAWFMRGGGSQYRERFITQGYDALDDPDAAAEFLATLAERITHATRGDAELIDVVRTGRLPGPAAVAEIKVNGRVNLEGFDRPGKVLSIDGDSATVRFTTPDGDVVEDAFALADLDPLAASRKIGLGDEAGINPAFTEMLNHRIDSGADIPQRIVGEDVRRIGGMKEAGNRLIDAGFHAFGSMPTNKFSRSPAFRQFYWKRTGEMIPYMDEPSRVAARAKAAEQGVSRKTLRAIDAEIAGTPPGTLKMADVDELARHAALDDTKNLLFDMSERAQFFDVFRVLFPFGDAWLEVLTRWGGITKRNPLVLRRLEQGITTGRSEGWFQEGAHGDEVFQYGPLSWALDGIAPQDMEGRLAGLNMVGDVFPGVGPAVQATAHMVWGDRADRQEWLNLITPYGAPSSVQDAFIPPYMSRFLDGFLQADQGWGNNPWAQWVPDEFTSALTTFGEFTGLTDPVRFERMRKDMMDHLVVNEGWPTSTQEEQEALLAEAGNRASLFLMAQGTAQSILPTTPIAQWQIETDIGLALKAEILDEWYELQVADFETALPTMLDTYGEDIWLVLQGKTRGVSLSAPLTATPLAWVREHPEVVERYPSVYGLFAPTPTEAEDIDQAAFDMLLESGGRENLTARQMLGLAQDRLAWSIYNTERDQFGPRLNDAQARYMQDVEEWLFDTYPGWQTPLGLAERSDVEQNIRQIQAAVADPVIAETPAGRGTIAFLEAWDAATAEGRKVSTANIPFATSAQTAPLRQYLRESAEWTISEYPEFAPVWRMVFERAIAAPDQEAR